jgi:hypothetical protein
LKNNTTGVREREEANRTEKAGNRDEVEGVAASLLACFTDWLDARRAMCLASQNQVQSTREQSEKGRHKKSHDNPKAVEEMDHE